MAIVKWDPFRDLLTLGLRGKKEFEKETKKRTATGSNAHTKQDSALGSLFYGDPIWPLERGVWLLFPGDAVRVDPVLVLTQVSLPT